ncbi:MAG: hypothetical protein CSA96_08130 [Bacteroidetes bacterium]|nr:MAG: hypothetical protein CSA96_08130 [Bacteroidota bacterium]
MKKSVILVLLPLCFGLLFAACEEKQPTPDKPDEEQNWKDVTLDATAYEDWVYFSFEQDAEVQVSDYLNSMDWDIAFHRYDVRLNCGTAGPGQGGSQSLGVVSFDSVTEAPESGYSLNDSIGVVLESGVWEFTNVPGDTVLASWMEFQGPPPTYTLSNEIYAIKTANGKYAKIWLKDYYNDMSVSGYVTMRYFYQDDGTRNFE